MNEQINELRNKLNNQVISNTLYMDILKTSIDIDKLILDYYNSKFITLDQAV